MSEYSDLMRKIVKTRMTDEEIKEAFEIVTEIVAAYAEAMDELEPSATRSISEIEAVASRLQDPLDAWMGDA